MSKYVTVVKPLDPRAAWFPKARFGMFVHFGLYSLLGRGEWVMRDESIPLDEYRKLTKRFNPRRFDANEWITAAQRAGARYFVITAKHHDGFCLFDSALTDYKVTNTPFGRDLIGEIVAACHRAGMRIVLYYSQPDWSHHNYVHRKNCRKDWREPRPGDRPDWPAYLRYCHGQVEELCTKYGRIDGIWFDGVHKSSAEWRGKEMYRLIKRLQPHAVVNDRAGYGDFFTPERRLSSVPSLAGYMVESCDCVAKRTWSYIPDAELKTSSAVLHSLIRMSSAGGNYILNVGPKPDGSLPSDWMRPLHDMGKWLRRHGASVYETRGCPRQEEGADRVYTRLGRRLYLHLLQWPETNRLVLKNLTRTPAHARLVGAKTRLPVEGASGNVTIKGLPATAPDSMADVIELVFDSKSFLKPPAPWPVPPPLRFNGVTPLDIRLSDAPGVFMSLKGQPLPTYPLRHELPEDFSNLMQPHHKIAWNLLSARAGWVDVTMEVACADNRHGSTFRITAGRHAIEGTIPKTPSWWTDHKTIRVGNLHLPKGKVKFTLQPLHVITAGSFGIVRKITLTPVPKTTK